ncbi:ATP-binding protein [Nocardiopsis sp. NPDC049922]|uniref:ATP-binding protein n=1 Tax=Nocardiopsis sp. NPDC049922 TaxID=3155157 RepID=UPI0033FBF13F
MSIVAQPRLPILPLPTVQGHRWPARMYPGDLSQCSRVRADLRADLAEMLDLPDDLTETIVLCASEAFANAAEHSRSGEDGGRVLRALYAPTPWTLRLVVVDDGARESKPEVPRQRTDREWEEAERGRGLFLIETLSSAWGTYPVVPFPFCADLGTAVWTQFTLAEAIR